MEKPHIFYDPEAKASLSARNRANLPQVESIRPNFENQIDFPLAREHNQKEK